MWKCCSYFLYLCKFCHLKDAQMNFELLFALFNSKTKIREFSILLMASWLGVKFESTRRDFSFFVQSSIGGVGGGEHEHTVAAVSVGAAVPGGGGWVPMCVGQAVLELAGDKQQPLDDNPKKPNTQHPHCSWVSTAAHSVRFRWRQTQENAGKWGETDALPTPFFSEEVVAFVNRLHAPQC